MAEQVAEGLKQQTHNRGGADSRALTPLHWLKAPRQPPWLKGCAYSLLSARLHVSGVAAFVQAMCLRQHHKGHACPPSTFALEGL